MNYNNQHNKQYKERKKPKNLIYGVHPILEAINSDKQIEKIFISRDTTTPQIKEIWQLARAKQIYIQKVPTAKLQSLTNGNHQGVAAFLSLIEYQDIEEILMKSFEEGKNPFVLVLDRITDVRNFGAIARTAECGGVDCIIVPSQGSAMINSDSIKTSAGALNRIPIHRSHNLKTTINYLKSSGLTVYALTEHAKDSYYDVNFNKPIAVVLGSEEDGISPEYLKICDSEIKIPMVGNISSLNVSVAAGIIIFASVKQRQNI